MTEKERKISNKSIYKFKIFDAYEGVIDISQKNFRLNQTQPLKVPNTIFLVLFGFCLILVSVWFLNIKPVASSLPLPVCLCSAS